MSLGVMLDEAIRLEETLSLCYETLSGFTPDDALARELNRFAHEEKNHVNVIKTGKNFLNKSPDMFGKEKVSDDEIRIGIRLVENLLDDIKDRKIEFLPAIKRIHNLGKKFEIVHLTTSVEFTEPSLKQLFEGLSKADADHRARLDKIMAGM